MQLQRDDIPKTVQTFELKNDSYGRYASFDYCYNYFHLSNSNDFTEDIEKSCKHFEPFINYIASLPNHRPHGKRSNSVTSLRLFKRCCSMARSSPRTKTLFVEVDNRP